MKLFKPKLEILPDAQRRLWKELGETPKHFVLYGGTALCLQLGHRESEDFDFFTSQPFSPDELFRETAYLKGSIVTQRIGNTLTCLVNRGGPIQVSFFGGLAFLKNNLEEPLQAEGTKLRVASLLDVAATKLNTIQHRAHYKDYYDIHSILRSGVSLRKSLTAAQALFGKTFNPSITLRALTSFGEGDLSRLSTQIKTYLVTEAEKLARGGSL